MSTLRIQPGDILVVQFLDRMDNGFLNSLGLVPLQGLKREAYRHEKASLAVVLFVLALLLSNWFPLPVTCLGAAVLSCILGVLRPNEIYEYIDWRILIYIACVIALGRGMETSGTSEFIADHFHNFLIGASPSFMVGSFFLLSAGLTLLLSNQGTAAIMVPLAITTAKLFKVDPMPLIMSVTMGASCGFITPFEPVYMLIYGAGNYSLRDFFRLGGVLTIIAFVLSVLLIPYFWWQ